MKGLFTVHIEGTPTQPLSNAFTMRGGGRLLLVFAVLALLLPMASAGLLDFVRASFIPRLTLSVRDGRRLLWRGRLPHRLRVV